jgi:hypothetical protein
MSKAVLLADDIRNVFGVVQPPNEIKSLTDKGGGGGLAQFIAVVISVIYVFAGIAFLFMVIISAFQWITSGGDKEAVAKARSRLTSAIIGFVLLALAGVIVTTFQRLTGFKIISGPSFP